MNKREWKAAKKRLEHKKYANQVLSIYDQMQRAVDRSHREAKSEVERAARKRW